MTQILTFNFPFEIGKLSHFYFYFFVYFFYFIFDKSLIRLKVVFLKFRGRVIWVDLKKNVHALLNFGKSKLKVVFDELSSLDRQKKFKFSFIQVE